jgi:hypothetical protein
MFIKFSYRSHGEINLVAAIPLRKTSIRDELKTGIAVTINTSSAHMFSKHFVV